ncbi:MAG: lipoprotein [Spiroplasma phoeniceum]|nr:MAG: lipoprotein [Spiroplasma phoeniceum]UZQ29104.1 MAG: lipoprotein [Spiroplasma phoeniceum]UZQ31476.1 MAG: lipoprotein [Spiroplasma phoeniceum]UZQ31514.1 MAG: lipoprotein [Spiroplasma phoeniceum]
MKKILSFLSSITLIGTSTTNLVACNKPKIHEYTPEELEHLKKENQINTANQEIKDNLERIEPQEKPFDNIDNKYYFVIWKGNNQWNIDNFKYDKFPIIISSWNKDRILINYKAHTVRKRPKELYLINSGGLTIKNWSEDNGEYFKSVYRWKLDKNIPSLVVNDKTGEIKVEGE